MEHALRGAQPGENLTIHEWAGLWNNGERYRVGDHVLLFLYSPGRLALTSPVAGSIGKFKLDAHNRILLTPLHQQAFSRDPALSGKSVIPFTEFAQAIRRNSQGK